MYCFSPCDSLQVQTDHTGELKGVMGVEDIDPTLLTLDMFDHVVSNLAEKDVLSALGSLEYRLAMLRSGGDAGKVASFKTDAVLRVEKEAKRRIRAAHRGVASQHDRVVSWNVVRQQRRSLRCGNLRCTLKRCNWG